MSSRRFGVKIMLVLLSLQGLGSCAYPPPEQPDATRESRLLTEISVTDLGDKLRIELDGGSPLSYTVSTSVVPPSVTVDLPGVSKGADLERMEVNHPPPASGDPSRDFLPQRWGPTGVYAERPRGA